jgi:hypothetical protein
MRTGVISYDLICYVISLIQFTPLLLLVNPVPFLYMWDDPSNTVGCLVHDCGALGSLICPTSCTFQGGKKKKKKSPRPSFS